MSNGSPRKFDLLIADVDGTLVTKEKVLTKRAIDAVRQLDTRGIAFAITSGRPPRGMRMLIDALDIKTPVAGFNGGAFVQRDMTIIESHPLDLDVAKASVESIAAARLDVWVYAGTDWMIRDLYAPHREREQRTVGFAPVVVSHFTEEHLARALKIVGISDDLERVAGCESSLREKFGKTATAARSQPYYVDVTHPRANKGCVLAYLSNALRIDPQRIATIGDQSNDIAMFGPSGFSIAMGNASEQVKASASAVTGSCDHEGFAEAVEKWIV